MGSDGGRTDRRTGIRQRLWKMNVGDVIIRKEITNVDVALFTKFSGCSMLIDKDVIYRFSPDVPRGVARTILQVRRFFPVVQSGINLLRKTDFFRVPRSNITEALIGGWITVDAAGYVVLTERGLKVPLRFVTEPPEPTTVTIDVPVHLVEDVRRMIRGVSDDRS